MGSGCVATGMAFFRDQGDVDATLLVGKRLRVDVVSIVVSSRTHGPAGMATEGEDAFATDVPAVFTRLSVIALELLFVIAGKKTAEAFSVPQACVVSALAPSVEAGTNRRKGPYRR